MGSREEGSAQGHPEGSSGYDIQAGNGFLPVRSSSGGWECEGCFSGRPSPPSNVPPLPLSHWALTTQASSILIKFLQGHFLSLHCSSSGQLPLPLQPGVWIHFPGEACSPLIGLGWSPSLIASPQSQQKYLLLQFHIELQPPRELPRAGISYSARYPSPLNIVPTWPSDSTPGLPTHWVDIYAEKLTGGSGIKQTWTYVYSL